MKLKKISERIFFSTIKMFLEDKDGNNTLATGSFVSKSITRDEVVIFLVASKEVIKNSVAATLTFAFKGEKPYVYKIIKNPKEKKEK